MDTVEKFELKQQPIPDLIPMVDLNSNHNHNVKSQSPSLSIHDPDNEQKDIELHDMDEASISIKPYSEYPNLIQIIGLTPQELYLLVDVKEDYGKNDQVAYISDKVTVDWDNWAKNIDQSFYFDEEETRIEYKVALYHHDKIISNIVTAYIPTQQEYDNRYG